MTIKSHRIIEHIYNILIFINSKKIK